MPINKYNKRVCTVENDVLKHKDGKKKSKLYVTSSQIKVK